MRTRSILEKMGFLYRLVRVVKVGCGALVLHRHSIECAVVFETCPVFEIILECVQCDYT